MRERNLLYLFLALNVGLAAAFAVYLFISNNGPPPAISTAFPPADKPKAATNSPPSPVARTDARKTNVPVMILPTEAKSPLIAITNQVESKPVFTAKKFTWEQIESQEYPKYIESLRAVGCPEGKVRYIVLADVNELCAKKRVKEAVTHDCEWWHADPDTMMVNVLREKGRQINEQRGELIARLLGPDAAEENKDEMRLWSNVPLTGEVLGSLSPELHNQLQEVCGRAVERNNSITTARYNGGQPITPVEAARLREQTRADVKQLLNREQAEEFLLRYSQNASDLRKELASLEPGPDEFRKIFRAIDPLDHQMQLDYGSKDALSDKQKERYERQREAIIREILAPQRFESYVLTKDPLYRQAQLVAAQYGASAKAVLPIYQTTKANEGKRLKIMNDSALTPQQKSDAINAIYHEQQQSIQQIAADTKGQ